MTPPDRAYQEALAQRIDTDGMSVRAVEEAARQHNSDQAAGVTDSGQSSSGGGAGGRLRPPGLLELEELLSAHLDTRVAISMGGSKGAKGKVTIEFATLEDLERIYRAMTSASAPHDPEE